MNIVKTNIRNRLHIQTVNSVLAIRYGLKGSGNCCYQYDVPTNYLKLIGSSECYDYNNNDDNDDNNDWIF
ncbi:hypothetical protein FF38_07473 [Lucilia cuprina]|uniref:Uncharacterized protein n=1 Tax=Lucilia cuprina TaxID=7375 RepID=A0A0L0CAZ5_LUCCU|nr:hypothetical protein FF38_07473 [Lucilia cuprina]